MLTAKFGTTPSLLFEIRRLRVYVQILRTNVQTSDRQPGYSGPTGLTGPIRVRM